MLNKTENCNYRYISVGLCAPTAGAFQIFGALVRELRHPQACCHQPPAASRQYAVGVSRVFTCTRTHTHTYKHIYWVHVYGLWRFGFPCNLARNAPLVIPNITALIWTRAFVHVCVCVLILDEAGCHNFIFIYIYF